MNSSDSFQLDEHLARLLAAYEQGFDGGDDKAPTISPSQLIPPRLPLPGERVVTPLGGLIANQASLGEVLPDPEKPHPFWPPKSPPPPPAPPPGTPRVGRYELRRQLGKGGCGIVFLAYDPKLEREVALKIPRPEMLMSQDARRRLVREALAAAEFDHPNLVPVYESGEIGPVCFIATAFCPGQTLGDWLDKQAYPVPVRQAARLVATVAEAVQHAHDRGVLHRDLKPANVILQATKEDPQEQEPPPGSCQLRGDQYIPRVVDFGLAKLLERGGPSETGTRQILGTPKYMAPEQAQGRHEDVGPTADVYALGVILYELITGRPPYEAASDVEVLRLAIEGQLTLPRHLRNDLPRDLEAICLKAMARVPGKRYRTAIDLADDLRRFLDGKPTLARPLNRFGRAARWLRRNDQAVALATVTVIAVFFFSVWAWNRYDTQRLNSNRDRALRRQEEARTQENQQREYARCIREAFLAWRSGDSKTAAEWLEIAGKWARTVNEPTDFPLGYLNRLALAERLHIICPAGPVTALAVSAEGTWLASGHADGTLAIWNRATGEQLGSVKAHDTPVTHVAFALGGSRLVTLGQVRTGIETAACWMVSAAGQIIPAPELHSALGKNVACVGVSPDGNTVFVGTRTGELRKIHLADAATRTVRLIRSGGLRVIVVSKDGNGVLVGTDGGKVFRLPATLQEPAAEDDYGGPITGLLESGGRESVIALANGLFVAGGDAFFLPTRGQVHWVLPLAEGFVATEAPGRLLLSGQRWGELPSGDLDEVRAGAVTRDGKTLFTAGDDGIIRSWELPADLRDQGAVAAAGAVRALAVHPDSRSFAVATDRSVTMNVGTKDERPGPDGRTFVALRMLREGLVDGTTLGVEFQASAVVVSELVGNQGTQEKTRFTLPDGAVGRSAMLSADGNRLAIGDDRGRVIVWSLPDRRTLTVVDCGHRAPVVNVAISENGTLVAALVAGNRIAIWTVGEPMPRVTVTAEEQAVFRIAPSGERLMIAGRSGVVRVWTIANGQEVLTLRGHLGSVSGLAVSADERTLASGGANGEVKLWDLRNGQELLSLRRHTGPVNVLEFAANGKLLVTGGGQIALWETRE